MQALKRHKGSWFAWVCPPPDFVGGFDMHQIKETDLEPHMACLLISAPGVESWRKPWLSDLTKRLVDLWCRFDIISICSVPLLLGLIGIIANNVEYNCNFFFEMCACTSRYTVQWILRKDTRVIVLVLIWTSFINKSHSARVLFQFK